MVLSEFLPSVGDYTDQLVASVSAKKALDAGLGSKADLKVIKLLSESYDKIFDLTEKLSADTDKAEGIEDSLAQAKYYHETIISDMEEIRKEADAIEGYLPDGVLPYPKYEDILFYI